MRKLNQKGFSAVEALLVIIILLLIGFIGYYVWHANKKTDNTYNSAAKTASTSTQPAQPKNIVYLTNGNDKIVSLSLPKTWQDESQKIQSSHASCSVTATNNLTPLAKGAASPATLSSNSNPLIMYDVVKQPDIKSLRDYFTDDLYGGTDAGIHTFTNLTINGNPAILYNGSGKPDGSDYKQQYYLVSHNGYVACLDWRSYDNGAASGTAMTDYSQYSADVKSIAQSIKFLN